MANKKKSAEALQRAIEITMTIYDNAATILKIKSLGGKRWKRNVAKGSRIGPWLQAEYKVLDQKKWLAKGACLYLVGSSDGRIRYVGISRNGLKHRWRTSPAYDAVTGKRLSENQLFHSQCWKHLEKESLGSTSKIYEVRVISANELKILLPSLGEPLTALAMFEDNEESIIDAIERWICNHKSDELAIWNSSMTW